MFSHEIIKQENFQIQQYSYKNDCPITLLSTHLVCVCVFMFVYVCFRDGCTCRERRGGERGMGEEGQWEGEQGRRGQRKWGRDFVQNGFVCI